MKVRIFTSIIFIFLNTSQYFVIFPIYDELVSIMNRNNLIWGIILKSIPKPFTKIIHFILKSGSGTVTEINYFLRTNINLVPI